MGPGRGDERLRCPGPGCCLVLHLGPGPGREHAHRPTDVNLGPWAADIWGSGEQWIFVSPGQPVTTTSSSNLLANGSFENSEGGWDRIIPSGDTTNITRYDNAADAHDGSWYLAFNTPAPADPSTRTSR
ncbi:MAG TPA: hypothetical protein VGH27_19395 [Streptosporangiaceae bacterium]